MMPTLPARDHTSHAPLRHLLAFVLLYASSAAPAPWIEPPAITGLRVQGDQILNDAGQPLRLLGVNRAGTEYLCIHGWGIFDGPADTASVQAIAAWHANAVRVPLNEQCWLGLNGVPAAYS